jgi:hypothetical protein
MPFIFNSVGGVGVKTDLIPLSSIKYFLIEIPITTNPGIIRKATAIYFMNKDCIRIGLRKEY